MTKTYIHVNQHKIRANKKHGTNEPVITVKQGRKKYLLSFSRSDGTYLLFVMVEMKNQYYLVVQE